MASRRFFGYDPWDHYYTPYPYYYQQPAANPEPRPRSRPVPVSIPVHFVGAEEAKKMETEEPKKRVMEAEVAAVRIQAASRGFLARRMVRAVRAVEREAEVVARRVAAEAAALAGDVRARAGVAEELMRLLFRLDAVRGAREYRRRVTRKVLALQDAVEALEAKVPAAAAVTVEAADVVVDGTEVTDVDMVAEHVERVPVPVTVMESAESGEPVPETVIESGEATEVANAVVGAEAATDADTVEMVTEPVQSVPEGVIYSEEPVPKMGIESVESADMEACAELDAKKATNDSKPEEPEGDSEVAMEEVVDGDATASRSAAEVKQKLELEKVADDANRLDAKKVMEMVVVLCERSAQQCTVIGALAERVDSLERAVRRMEEAKRKRKQKMNKGSKKSMRSCYID